MKVNELIPCGLLRVDIVSKDVESLLEIGSKNLKAMIGLWRKMISDNLDAADIEEKILILSDLADKAESKPVFPFYRTTDYLADNAILFLRKNHNLKPRWKEVKHGFYGSGVQIGSILFGYTNPNLISETDLRYLKKHYDFAEIWVGSTRKVLNHKARHCLLYSFR